MAQITSGSLTIVDVTDGAPGLNNTTVFLYRRAVSAPDKPTGNLTYTFSTASITGALEGWVQSISELTGSNPIWMIAAVASSNGGTDVIESSEWAGPIKMAQNGQDGSPGAPGAPGAPGTNGLNQATIFIYKRDDNATTPSKTIYTFANGSFTVPSGWSKTIPTEPKGKPCWVTSAIAIGAEATAELKWAAPSVLVEDGSDGVSPTVTKTENGVKIDDGHNVTYITNGKDGTSYYTFVRYSKNSDGSGYVDTPTSETIYIGVYSGTKSSPPAYNDSGWTWSKYVGADGKPGTQGPTGPTGPTGPRGVSVVATRELYYLKTNSTDPAQITNANQIHTDDDVNQWTSVVPTYIGSGKYYTCIETTLSNGNVVWSAPVENKGLTDANVNAANAIEIARGVKQHFFWVATDKSANVPAGAYVAEQSEESFYSNPTKGNILTRSDGIWIRNGVDKLATLQGSGLTFLVPTGTYKGQKSVSLNGSGLTFYNIGSSNSAAATLASDGLQITNGSIVLGTTSGTSAGNVTLSNKNFTRAINGTSHNDLRFAIGSKFGVASDGTLYSSGLDSVVSRVDIAETSLGDKVDTSTFNTLSQTVDGNSASITELSTITTNNGLTKTTNITNTVNTVSQTATGNSSKISSLTNTLGTNADGTTKAGDIVHRTSAVEQDLSGFKSTVSSTYETKTDASTKLTEAKGDATKKANKALTDAKADTTEKLKSYSTTTQMNSAIEQKANSIALSVAQTEISKIEIGGRNLLLKTNQDTANINISIGSGKYTRSTIPLSNGGVGLRWDRETSTSSWFIISVKSIDVANDYIRANPGKAFTLSFELRSDGYSTSPLAATIKRGDGKEPLTTSTQFLYIADMVNSWERYELTFMSLEDFPEGTNQFVYLDMQNIMLGDRGNASYVEIKNIKLEKGNKATDWTPAPEDVEAYTDTQISAAKAEIKVTTDGISTEVAKKTDKSTIISTIRQSAETVKIKASQVEIDGSAIFSNTDFQTKLADSQNAYTVLWDRNYGTSSAGGEAIIQKKDPLTGAITNAAGWVIWNGTKRTVPAVEYNPNTLVPYNIPVYLVLRLSSASSTTGTVYPVWYANSKWNYLNKGVNASTTDNAVADWTWVETTDIVLGSCVEPASEAQFTDCYIYDPPLTCKQVTSDTVTARSANAAAAAAQTTANNAAPKSSAVAEEHYIYISKASGTTSVSGTTTWITEAGDKQNTWSTKRPTYNSSYPVLFVAKQKKVVSGTVTCTMPIKDDTTTIIDGGHITTGTIDTNRLNADTIKSNIVQTTDLNASKIKSGTLDAARIGANSITADKISIGAIEEYENILLDSDAPTLTKVKASYDRYFSDAGNNKIVCSNFTLTDAPEQGLNYGRRFTYDGSVATNNYLRSYAFYSTNDNAIPLVPNQTYTATWWARCTSGSGRTQFYYSKGDGASGAVSGTIYTLTSYWKKYTCSFTFGSALNTNYNRVWFRTLFPKSTAGTVEICGCKLTVGADAESYITRIDNNGIRIHPSSTENNSVVINGSGMEVFKGGIESENSVAKYGDTSRIGKESSYNIQIDSDSVDFVNNGELVTSLSSEYSPSSKSMSLSSGYGDSRAEARLSFYNYSGGFTIADLMAAGYGDFVWTELSSVGWDSSTDEITSETTLRLTPNNIRFEGKVLLRRQSYDGWEEVYIAADDALHEGTYRKILSYDASNNCILGQGQWTQNKAGYNTYVEGYETNIWGRNKIATNMAITQGSDKRLKKDIKNFENVKDFVMDLKPVEFKYEFANDKAKHLGFIAQDVEKSMDAYGLSSDKYGLTTEITGTDNIQYKGLNYTEFIPICIKMIQEQQQEINALKEALNEVLGN